MSSTISRQITLESTSCCSCGITFAVPDDWLKARRRDGKGFHCPNGHSLTYGDCEIKQIKRAADETAAKLRSAITALAAAQDQAQAAERSRIALKGQLTKERNRIANGVCPCCRRSFVDLHRHMSDKHPDYVEVAGD